MKARKILAVSLTAAMTLALAACGGSSSDKESSSKDSSDKVYKIGICQQLEHAALDEATKGFEEACEEKFGKDKVKFDLQNGQGEQRCRHLSILAPFPARSLCDASGIRPCNRA